MIARKRQEIVKLDVKSVTEIQVINDGSSRYLGQHMIHIWQIYEWNDSAISRIRPARKHTATVLGLEPAE